MSNNNQCPQCHDYPEYRGACGVCGGTGTQPQSREQTKATVGDSTQNAVQPQESTTAAKGHAPHCQSLLVVGVPCTCKPKETKLADKLARFRERVLFEMHKHKSAHRDLEWWVDHMVILAKEVFGEATAEAADLSSWLKTPHRLAVDGKGYVWRVYEEGVLADIEKRFDELELDFYKHMVQQHGEATAVSHDTPMGASKWKEHGEKYGYIEYFGDALLLDTPSKSPDKEYNYYLGIDYALQHDPAFRREYIRKHEAPTSSDGQGVQESSAAIPGVSEDTMLLDEILAFNLSDCDMELHPNAYLFINQTTPKIRSLLSSEKVKELKALVDKPGGDHDSAYYDAIKRIKELEG